MQEFVLLGVIMILVLGGYWSLVLFPRQREFQKRQRYVQSLNIGDEVVTYGGIIGKMVDLEAERGIARLEIADGVTIRVVTASIMHAYDPEEIAKAAATGQSDEAQQPG